MDELSQRSTPPKVESLQDKLWLEYSLRYRPPTPQKCWFNVGLCINNDMHLELNCSPKNVTPKLFPKTKQLTWANRFFFQDVSFFAR